MLQPGLSASVSLCLHLAGLSHISAAPSSWAEDLPSNRLRQSLPCKWDAMSHVVCRSKMNAMRMVREFTEQVAGAQREQEQHAAALQELDNQMSAMLSEIQKLESKQANYRWGPCVSWGFS